VHARFTTAAVAVAMFAFPASTFARFGDKTLSTGMTGHDVRVMQSWLDQLGFHTDIDGQFGRHTRSALRRFEKTKGLPVNGVLTTSDAALLRTAMQASTAGNGGQSFSVDQQQQGDQAQPGTYQTETAPGSQATMAADGLHAVAPADAPPEVQQAIDAANRIVGKPYKYGGGHGKWDDSGYDCSGTVSYALHAAGMLDTPMASGDLESWGASGEGSWITVYANGGHAYAVIAGLRLDTSGSGGKGPRWHEDLRSTSGYRVRHWRGV
jgi:peptidoglycan hydrolase-like protein with peptidoglycan-binding domain